MADIIGLHFTLKNQSGDVLGGTRGKNAAPLLVLLGSGGLLIALEREINDMSVGQSKTVILPPAQAYGDVDKSLRLIVPRSKFPEGTDIKEGLQFEGGQRDGWPIRFRVVKIDGDDIYVDANHELAGMELHYDVEIMQRREATADELAHGHAHGAGGHQH